MALNPKRAELRDAFPKPGPARDMGHRFASDGDDVRCLRCDSRPGGLAGSLPCPDGLDVLDVDPEDLR